MMFFAAGFVLFDGKTITQGKQEVPWSTYA